MASLPRHAQLKALGFCGLTTSLLQLAFHSSIKTDYCVRVCPRPRDLNTGRRSGPLLADGLMSAPLTHDGLLRRWLTRWAGVCADATGTAVVRALFLVTYPRYSDRPSAYGAPIKQKNTSCTA